ncbi:HNH endonuclease signature motif containing protein [Arthrobacter sp. UCD-GKA]|uniref:HNH endonuclease signature motif containing protein n=1 Tax=Arthrobacter sp. UCD-GKA TaxID=1913576 RepID=UPI001587092E|nr:HNH endonuclease signature motif containing protein [Arthrobacter sp. UCD-GKA]
MKPIKICSIPDCGRTDRIVRGWCRMHYERWGRTGDPLGDPTKHRSSSENFWAQIEKTDTCWNWTGYKHPVGGYGMTALDGRQGYAHRFTYEMANGPIPEGMQLDHMCHNPGCANPAHLRVVTSKQNLENLSGPQLRSKSGARGVYPIKNSNKWRVAVGHHGKQIHVGCFATLDEAKAAAMAKRNELFTHNLLDRVAA